MKAKRTPIASAVALALMSAFTAAHAQDAAAPAAAASAPQPAQAASAPAATEKPAEAATPAKGAQNLEAVIVTGIRGSLQQSLNKKRNADSVVDVITSEDIGKMPDKNVADSLQRVPGVNISSAGAGEGGFDEADRVSLRGTNPSLTQTMINGHMVGSGDWFVLNQVGTVGRSVSYSLLPSELVDTVVINKSSRADLVEGGVAGTVDIQTRKPLDFKKQVTLEATVGAVYADLPEKTDPQLSAMFNWQNDAKTFGVLVQGFSEKRHLRRDGQEMLGYTQIAPNSTIAQSNPDLAGVWYPNAIGSALFEQERKRTGGLIDVQIKPTNDLTLDLSAFKSHMEATNFNRNFLVWPKNILNAGAGQAPLPGYVVQNNTLVSASFAPGAQAGIVDQIYRPGANADSTFYNLDGKLQVNDRFAVSGKLGTSKGKGETPKQAVYEADVKGTGASYTLHGLGSPADAALIGGDPSNYNAPGTGLDWVFGASPASTLDKENWGQLDGEYALDAGIFTTLKFGVRVAEHKRESNQTGQGPAAGAFDAANQPAWNGTTYPGDFGSGLGGGVFPRNPWQLDPAILEAWSDKYSNRDPVLRRNWAGEFSLKEKNSAAYVMSSFEGTGWGGNVGVRIVRTGERVLNNFAIKAGGVGEDCEVLHACSVPGAITTSAFGPFYQKEIANDYTDVLPSLNLRYDLSKDLVSRFGIAKTMARPDYSALGGSVSLDDLNHTGSGGNPNLEPIRSTNVDASLEWYFAPRSLLSAGLFYMDLTNYVGYGTTDAAFVNIKTGASEIYRVTSPLNSSGSVKGIELAYQQPVGAGFGFITNYTYADAKESGGGPLVGASKNTYNVSGYFENDSFNARVNYSFRSKFYNGLDRSTAQYQDDTDNVSASIGYKVSDNLTITLDGMNLNNPKLKYYANNPDQPTAFYVNGRQYYLSLRLKM
ncbi:iron complex outermembrane receptor protein [Rhizobacter sp. SG703]|nr:iron complex outermembrane receptor protein [Rhizobacter sp. SG703]